MYKFLPSMRWLAVLALVIACGDESGPDGLGTGDLNLTVITTGAGLDSSYVLIIDGDTIGEIGANETRVVNDMRVGNRSIRLAGLADNCEYSGILPVTVHIQRDEQVTLTLELSCRTAGPVRLIVASGGPAQDPDGYRYGLDASPSKYLGIHDTIVFPDVAPGDHRFQFDGLAKDCHASPDDRIDFTVTGEDTLTVFLSVGCLSFAGDRIVFASNRGGGSGPDGLELWSTLTDGSDPIRLTTNASADDQPVSSRGGWFVAFTRSQAGGPSQVWLVNYDGSDEFQATSEGAASAPAWSPSGILVWVERLGTSDVYDLKYSDFTGPGSVTVGSTDPNRVTRRFSPAWSADDRRIVFASDTSINSIDVYRPGYDETLLRRMNGVTHLDWAHETHRIVFNAPPVDDPAQPGLHGTGAWIMNENGSGLVQVMTSTANSSWNTPRWDPTGTRLTFSRVMAGSTDSKIWTAKADGSEAVEVAGAGSVNIHPSWP